jgi:tetratricopeptide (TPR) repeat protein
MPDSAVLLRDGVRAEMLGMLDRALAAYREVASRNDDPDAQAEALWRQADVLRVQCEWESALAMARHAQQIALAVELPARYAEALNAEASVHLAHGNLTEARAIFEKMIATTNDLRLRGIGLQNLGAVHAQQGDLDLAEHVFSESHTCFRECEYERGQAIALNNQGRAALDRGDHERAVPILERAVAAARRVEDEDLLALSTTNLADATLAAGDQSRANELVCTALGHFSASGNRWREVECLRLLGTINEQRGFRDEARRCYERGLRIATEIDAQLDIGLLTELLGRVDRE